MLCNKCGKSVNENSQFCENCGNKLAQVASNASGKSGNFDLVKSENIARKATVEYLEKIRDCELIKKQLLKKIQCKEYEQSQLAIPKTFYDVLKKPMKLGCLSSLLMIVGGVGLFFWLLYAILPLVGGVPSNAAASASFQNGCLYAVIVSIVLLIPCVLLAKRKQQKEYNARLAEHNEAIATDNRRVVQDQATQQNIQNEITSIEEELRMFEQKLQSLYALNVVPDKFRSLYPVYFIHNFMSTSETSLAQTFLHCDLDKIQQQLGQIIEQNQAMLVQQCITNARLANIQVQNEAYYATAIDYAKNIERNSEKAAHYARMADMSLDVSNAMARSRHL